MSEQVDRSGLVSGAGALAVLVSLIAFAPIVQGASWWFTGVLFVVAAVAVSAAARRLGLPTAAGALLGLAVLPLVATAAAGGGGGLLLMVPTDVSAERVVALLGAAGEQVYTDSVPARDTTAIALLIGAGAGVAAVVIDAVAVGLRAPLAGMLVVLALALVPGKALGTGTDGLFLVTVAVAVLLVVAADRRRRGAPPRLPGLAAGGAVALVVALVAQVVLPTPTASQAAQVGPPGLFASGADPLLRLGENLRRGLTTSVVRYSTTGPRDVYLRLAVLEDFRGEAWAPNAADGSLLSARESPVPAGLRRASGDPITTTIEPAGPSAIGERLPLPYPALSVDGVRSAFRWEERGLTLVRAGTEAMGSYTVESADVDTSAERLAGASVTVPPGDEQAVTVPRRVPRIVRATAERWTSEADNPYEAALAIQNQLRNGPFSYDEETPAEEGYDGDGLGVIATFLRERAGYCVHFASTMAVMARLQGIPSRIAVGYQPGEASADTAGRLVTSDDLHAWPELYFDGIGWVRFEPTPGRGSVPSYAPLPSFDPSASATTTPTSGARRSLDPSAAADGGTGSSGPDLAAIGMGALRVAGVLALVVLLLAIPGAVRRVVRRRRLARLDADGAVGAWRELLDSIADLGLPTGRGRSPREAEAVIADQVGPGARVRSALTRLRVGYERHAFGPSPAPAAADDVRTVVRAAADRAGRSRRFLAAVAPRSLLGTLAPSRLALRWSPSGSD